MAATTVTALVAAASVALAAPSTEGADMCRQIAQGYAAAVHGAATFVVQTKTVVRGGPMTHTEESETAYVIVDGAPAGKRVLRNVINGKAADEGSLAKLSAEPDGPISRFGMRLPLLEAAMADYQYGAPRERGSFLDVDFATTVKDQSHGDGTLTLEGPQKRIAELVVHPAVLPPHATNMTITIEFGAAYEGRWDILKVTRTFAGREGLLTGKGTTTSAYAYHPYASQAEALKALQELTPSST